MQSATSAERITIYRVHRIPPFVEMDEMYIDGNEFCEAQKRFACLWFNLTFCENKRDHYDVTIFLSLQRMQKFQIPFQILGIQMKLNYKWNNLFPNS